MANYKFRLYSYKIGNRLRSLIAKNIYGEPYENKLILVIGPESTGTRVFTTYLSEHPDILGTPKAQGHLDILDEVWQALEKNQFKKALDAVPTLENGQHILTRRSMPHSTWFGDPAKFIDFENLYPLQHLCRKKKLELVVLITSRSPIPNIASMVQSRRSVRRSFSLAVKQYHESFRDLFGFLNRTHTEFYFLSLEGFLLDGDDYLQSIFSLLGLQEYELDPELRTEVNKKHYEWFRKNYESVRP